MNSRDIILRSIRRQASRGTALPAPLALELPEGEHAPAFASSVEAAGGRVAPPSRAPVAERVQAAYPDAAVVASACPDLVPGTVDVGTMTRQDLAGVDLFVCKASVGVAENGALWLDEDALVHRAAPFLAEHVAILVGSDALVWTMHEAYERIDVAATSFGVFIAGPSKTADIEQSLVIGAHGPRSLTVVVL